MLATGIKGVSLSHFPQVFHEAKWVRIVHCNVVDVYYDHGEADPLHQVPQVAQLNKWGHPWE